MQIIVTGANRGIGLELVRQYLERGDAVVAACRAPQEATALQQLTTTSPNTLRILACDVGDDASVAAFAVSLQGLGVDLLLNNAGIGDWAGLAELSMETALRVYSINALGPLRVTRALLPNLRSGQGRRVVHVSSGMGSIGDNSSGGAYAYRMSKAALNMASKCLALDLADEKIISAVINPGWVQTDMGGAGASITATESVAAMIARFDTLTLAHSGAFLDWRGAEYPW